MRGCQTRCHILTRCSTAGCTDLQTPRAQPGALAGDEMNPSSSTPLQVASTLREPANTAQDLDVYSRPAGDRAATTAVGTVRGGNGARVQHSVAAQVTGDLRKPRTPQNASSRNGGAQTASKARVSVML